MWKLENYHSPWGGIFSHIHLWQRWQLHPIIHHTMWSFTQHIATDMLHDVIPQIIGVHFKNIHQHLNILFLCGLSPLPSCKSYNQPAIFGLQNMWKVTYQLLHIAGCYQNSCLTTQTIQRFELTGHSIIVRLVVVVPSFMMVRCPITSVVLAACSQHRSMLYTELPVYSLPTLCYLYMDSPSALQSFHSCRHYHPKTLRQVSYVSNMGKSAIFCWLPNCTALHCNEACEAVALAIQQTEWHLSCDIYARLHCAVLSSWQDGPIHRAINFWQWSHTWRCGSPLSILLGERKSCLWALELGMLVWHLLFAMRWLNTSLCTLWSIPYHFTYPFRIQILQPRSQYISSARHVVQLPQGWSW
jgi:hypothetical protein